MADMTHGGAAHSAEHPPFLQHHFDTPAQQFEASKLGMWLFLATEVLFFSGLFCAYAVYRRLHPDMFMYAYSHGYLSVFWGAVNTVVLIASSFTMALGVYYAQRSNQAGLVVCLILTLLGACGFMVIKGIEYTDKYQKGKLWGHYYNPVKEEKHGDAQDAAKHDDPAHAPAVAVPAGAAAAESETHDAPHAAAAPPAAAATPPTAAAPAPTGFVAEKTQILPPKASAAGINVDVLHGHKEHGVDHAENVHVFLGIYFCMTGLHGLHVLAGMVVLTWLLIGAIQGKYNADYYTPVDLGGLYWHLVDLIWIYLFPLLYLIH